jgi:beta-lactamase class A
MKPGILALALALLLAAAASCQKPSNKTDNARPEAAAPKRSAQSLVDEAAKTTLERFKAKGLEEKHLAITLVDLRNPAQPEEASFRGDERIYPASVVKLFYLAAAHRWLEDGKLSETNELNRALRDMIVDSSNDASHYVVDALTGTTSGLELPPDEMAIWGAKRNAVNRYFTGLGYASINVNQKPWCEGPYGRERAYLGEERENRNKLTTRATARLLTEIATGKAVTRERSAAMLALLRRDRTAVSQDQDDQANGFTGVGLEPSARLFSKAGWTSEVRHDAAYVELPGGARFVLVTFTVDFSGEREIIGAVARSVVAGLGGSGNVPLK